MESPLEANLSEEERKNLLGISDRCMMWQLQWDNRFAYYVYVPESLYTESQPLCKVFVAIHGTNRQLRTKQLEIYQKFADENHCVIVYPFFAAGVVVPDDINEFKMMYSNGIHYDEILLKMLEEVKARYKNVEIDRFFLAGHSGGGQYANRFYYLHPERLFGVNIGAPGRPTFPDRDVDYYFGIRDWEVYFGKKIDLDMLKKVPVLLTVGELDTKFIGNSSYGVTRNERIETLRKMFSDLGINVKKQIIPGMAHPPIEAYWEATCEFCKELLNK